MNITPNVINEPNQPSTTYCVFHAYDPISAAKRRPVIPTLRHNSIVPHLRERVSFDLLFFLPPRGSGSSCDERSFASCTGLCTEDSSWKLDNGHFHHGAAFCARSSRLFLQPGSHRGWFFCTLHRLFLALHLHMTCACFPLSSYFSIGT